MSGAVQNSSQSHSSLPEEWGTRQPRVGNAFPRTSKLLKHALFDQVYQRGQRHFSGLMTVFFLRRTEEQHSSNGQAPIAGPRVGFTVGRVLGNSVKRNRIRRRMREAVRVNLGLLPPDVDVVINPKKIVLEAEFARIVAEVEKAFKKVAGSQRPTANDGS